MSVLTTNLLLAWRGFTFSGGRAFERGLNANNLPFQALI